MAYTYVDLDVPSLRGRASECDTVGQWFVLCVKKQLRKMELRERSQSHFSRMTLTNTSVASDPAFPNLLEAHMVEKKIGTRFLLSIP